MDTNATYHSYVPKLLTSQEQPTLGLRAAAFGRFVQIGTAVMGRAQINFGPAGTTSGSGIYYITLPVKGKADKGNLIVGQGWIFHKQEDAMGNKFRLVVLELDKDGDRAFFRVDHIPQLNSDSPWQWDKDDSISVAFNYEAA